MNGMNWYKKCTFMECHWILTKIEADMYTKNHRSVCVFSLHIYIWSSCQFNLKKQPKMSSDLKNIWSEPRINSSWFADFSNLAYDRFTSCVIEIDHFQILSSRSVQFNSVQLPWFEFKTLCESTEQKSSNIDVISTTTTSLVVL